MENKKIKPKMVFTSTKLTLPLFMLQRQPLKNTKFKEIRSYIEKKSKHYTATCERENDLCHETATFQYLRHVPGLDEASKPSISKPCPKRLLNVSRGTNMDKPFHLPPNLYNTLKVPFQNRMGNGCVKWHVPSPKPKRIQIPLKWYSQKKTYKGKENIYEGFEDIFSEFPPERKKCQLDTNARTLPPTSRSMRLDQPDPCSPGPAFYNPQHCQHSQCQLYIYDTRPEFSYASTYRFLRGTNVPETETFVNKLCKNSSFAAGPGRYDIRYGCTCKKWLNRTYEPDLQWLIIKQKRLKFLGLPNTKIDPSKYFCPEYQNIKGHGHTYRFKGAKKIENTTVTTKVESNIDGPYIQRILNPKRRAISLKPKTLQQRTSVKVKYNCMMRFVRKKALIFKKIGFLSSQPRFKDDEPPKPMTAKEIESFIKLHPEKRIRNYPITNTPLEDINGKLYDIPTHQIFMCHRKKPFKFLPIPGVKKLVEQEDYTAEIDENDGYYFGKLKPEDYFKDKSHDSLIVYPSIYEIQTEN